MVKICKRQLSFCRFSIIDMNFDQISSLLSHQLKLFTSKVLTLHVGKKKKKRVVHVSQKAAHIKAERPLGKAGRDQQPTVNLECTRFPILF